MHRFNDIDLMPGSLGTARRLRVHCFGTSGAVPKVYVQASLHADETPAMPAAHYMMRRLREADARREVCGEVVVVPVANPVGLSQRMLNLHVGRGDLGGSGNYNRGFPDLGAAALARLDGRLGPDTRENDRLARAALRDSAAELQPTTEVEALRVALLRVAADAHMVLDLHCHFEGITYLYCNAAGWPGARDLSAQIGSQATLVGDGGGGSFDEACDAPWRRIREAFRTGWSTAVFRSRSSIGARPMSAMSSRRRTPTISSAFCNGAPPSPATRAPSPSPCATACPSTRSTTSGRRRRASSCTRLASASGSGKARSCRDRDPGRSRRTPDRSAGAGRRPCVRPSVLARGPPRDGLPVHRGHGA